MATILLLVSTLLCMTCFDTAVGDGNEAPSWYLKRSNTNCHGNDISEKTTKHAKECAELCDQTEGCVAFAFARNSNRGNCHVKSICHLQVSYNQVDLYEKKKPIATTSFDPIGEVPKDDTFIKEDNYQSNLRGIKSVGVFFVEHGGKQYITGLKFEHNHHSSFNTERKAKGGVLVLNLTRGEFITKVEVQKSYFHISWLRFTTNVKGRDPVSVGNERGIKTFTFEGKYGGPLLYASVVQGLYLYQIRFTFMDYEVSSAHMLEEYRKLAVLIYNTWNTNVEKLPARYIENKWMLPDLLSTECYWYNQEKAPGYQMCCRMNSILQQLAAFVRNTERYKTYQPRLLEYGNYDTGKLLELKSLAKNFRETMNTVTITAQQTAAVTVQVGRSIGNYFKTVEKFNKAISEEDKDELSDRIKTLKNKHHRALKEVKDSVIVIMGVAIGSLGADALFDYGMGGLEAINALIPLNWDVADATRAADKFAASLAKVAGAAALAGMVSDFMDQVKKNQEKIEKQGKQSKFLAMQAVIEKLETADAATQEAMAADFVTAYGDFRPALYPEDLEATAAKLQALVDKACSMVESAESGGGVIVAQGALKKCIDVHGQVAFLNEVYIEWYNAQLQIVDVFTAIVRSHVAINMAEEIQSVENTIDLTTITTLSLMVELRFQAGAQAACDEIEYAFAGYRPEVCKNLFFNVDLANDVISFDGSSIYEDGVHLNAYIPTQPLKDPTMPWMNITSFLAGESFDFSIPSTGWGLDNGWFKRNRLDERPLSAYYVKSIELYLPGLSCRDREDVSIKVEATAASYTKLFFTKATIKYQRSALSYSFEYNYKGEEGRCTSRHGVEIFDVEFSNEDGEVIDRSDSVCVESKGQQKEEDTKDLASLLSTWTFRLSSSEGCDLMYEGELQPKASVKINAIQIDPPKLDLCWPQRPINPGRCPIGQVCQTIGLTYSCN